MAKQSKIQSKTRWVRALRAWKKSGLKASAFCRKNGLGVQSFYAWRRRLAGPKTGKARGPSAGLRAGRRSFLPVQVVTSPCENQVWMELVLKNGRVLRLYRKMPVAVLAELALGLEAEAC
jgi:hypothetical protein